MRLIQMIPGTCTDTMYEIYSMEHTKKRVQQNENSDRDAIYHLACAMRSGWLASRVKLFENSIHI